MESLLFSLPLPPRHVCSQRDFHPQNRFESCGIAGCEGHLKARTRSIQSRRRRLVQALRLGTLRKFLEISPNSHLQGILKPHLKPPAHPASFAFGTASRPVAFRCQKRLSGGIFFAVNMRILAEYRKISAREFKIMPQLPCVQPFLYGFFEAFSRLTIRLNV